MRLALLTALLAAACEPDLAPDFEVILSEGDAGTHVPGLPCAIVDIVNEHCVSCHGSPPTQGAPFPLLSISDFTASSPLYPAQTVGLRALVRVEDMTSPMPPVPNAPLTQAQLASFSIWVGSNMPVGTCGAIDAGIADAGTPDAGVGPFPTVCTSGRTWTFGNAGSSTMNPGLACRACHLGQNFLNQNPTGVAQPSRAYDFMGTVYGSFHEKDLCLGSPPGPVSVQIVDANGNVALRLAANSAGNFYSGGGTGVALPYTARVVYAGRTRAMTTPQTVGDCNTCHTEQGLSGAPGRIVWP